MERLNCAGDLSLLVSAHLPAIREGVFCEKRKDET